MSYIIIFACCLMPFEVPQINTQESIRKDVMIKTSWLLYKFLLAISAHIVLYMLLNVPVPSHESYKYPGLGKQINMQKIQSMQSKKNFKSQSNLARFMFGKKLCWNVFRCTLWLLALEIFCEGVKTIWGNYYKNTLDQTKVSLLAIKGHSQLK